MIHMNASTSVADKDETLINGHTPTILLMLSIAARGDLVRLKSILYLTFSFLNTSVICPPIQYDLNSAVELANVICGHYRLHFRMQRSHHGSCFNIVLVG